MKKLLGLLVVIGLVGAPALAQKITIDYDHDFDFDAVKTFQYVETKESNAESQLTDGKIRGAIIREMIEGGLKQVESGPDILVTYHLTTEESTVYTTSHFGYGGYGDGWGGYGRYGYGGYGGSMGSSTTTATNFTEGTIIVDAYEPGEKKMVWRGTGMVTVKAKPEKQTQQINKILAKMGAKWDKIIAGKGK